MGNRSEELEQEPAAAPRPDRKNRAWWWLAVAGFLAVLAWQIIRSTGDPMSQGAAEPFAEIRFAPLIKGDGLGDGSATLPWPADFAVPARVRPSAVGAAEVHAGGDLRPPMRTTGISPPARGRYSSGSAISTPGTAFASLDLNDDGRLSPAEFAIHRGDAPHPRHKGMKADDMPPYVSTGVLNRTIVELRRVDEDDDWFLSRSEFAAAAP